MIYGINPLVLLFASLGLWVVLLVTETLKRNNLLAGENARKTIHIFSGFFLALLPVMANRREIVAVNVLFFVGVVLFAGVLHKFSSIDDIKRWSWGQFLYPIGLLLVAISFKDPVIYSFATLELALADGFAAVFGERYGKIKYHILGASKTLIGSAIFFLITLTIFYVYADTFGVDGAITYNFLIAGAVGLTIVEGSIAAGFDNLFIPYLTAIILSSL